MFKLLIVDDEPFIRESMTTMINWKALGINLIGTAADGIEAYNIILDEYPDIVMTDIRMPELSGLELIQKIRNINKETIFIILSGYSDFEYAKEAMKYGIRHYLLKPCTEEQIISCITETTQELTERMAQNQTKETTLKLSNNVFLSLFNQCIAYGCPINISNISNNYEKYLDFQSTPYELCHLYFVEKKNLREAIDLIGDFRKQELPGVSFQYIYVKNTLLLFCLSLPAWSRKLDEFLTDLTFQVQTVAPVYKRVRFLSLEKMLEDLLPRISRYDTIYYSNGFEILPLCNYRSIIQHVMQLTEHLCSTDTPYVTQKKYIHQILEMLSGISDIEFLRQLASTILLRYASQYGFSTLRTAEYLLGFSGISNAPALLEDFHLKITELLEESRKMDSPEGLISTKIKTYVSEHLDNPDLSLKWISENYLYMNVDYISKRFFKETNQKFSNYLTEVRINKAKELLTGSGMVKIQYIAEKMGCGNNPKYFSQLFKRSTGMTPSNYIKMISGGKQNEN